jgi:invasion protein IalB
MICKTLSCIGVLVIGLSSHAHAQTPQRTSATYDDWTLSCVMAGNKKSCAIIQSQTIQGQAVPVSQVSISRSANGDPSKIFFQVPSNVWLPTGVALITGQTEADWFAANFVMCAATRCVAAATLTDAQIKSLRSQRTAGKFVYQNTSQANISIPISFKGLGDALDALQKE